MRLVLPALALLIALPAQAQDVDAQIAAAADALAPAARSYAKTRNGHPQVAGSVTLADAIPDAGRMIARVDVMQEWDCKTGRYRITRKTLRTSDGQYVRSDPRNGPWVEVADQGPGSATLKRLCPGRTAKAAAPEELEIPPGAQVIEFPER